MDSLPETLARMGNLNLNDEYFRGHEDALQPLGINFISSGLVIRRAYGPWVDGWLKFLEDRFRVTSLWHCAPWIVLYVDGIPPNVKMPRYIGGLIAVWVENGSDDPFWPWVGEIGFFGYFEDDEVDANAMDVDAKPTIDDDILSSLDLVCGKPPSVGAAEILASKLADDCIGLTYIYHGTMIVELKDMDPASFQRRLDTIPTQPNSNFPYHVRYHNGLISLQRLRELRLVDPIPQVTCPDGSWTQPIWWCWRRDGHEAPLARRAGVT